MKTAYPHVLTAGRWLSVAVFGAFLVLPTVDHLVRIAPRPAFTENRYRARPPRRPVDARTLRLFPREFERFYNDRFGFRDGLAYAYNYALWFGLRTSPSRKVLAGRDGWLFFGHPDELTVFQRAPPFTGREREATRQGLDLLGTWSRRTATPLLLVAAPDKSTIYPDRMPACYRRAAGPDRLDQVLRLCREAGVAAVDLRPALRAARSGGPVYYRLDTHWNAEGAFVAYRELLTAANALVPGLRPVARAELPAPPPGRGTGDLAKLLGLPGDLTEPFPVGPVPDTSGVRRVESAFAAPGLQLREFAGPDPGAPTALVFHDSFGVALLPFLLPHFRRTVAVAYGHVDPELVERVRPDLVICEFVERSLANAPAFLGDLRRLAWRALRRRAAVDLPGRVGENTAEAASLIGAVRTARRGATPPGFLVYGPYLRAAPGRHAARFRVRAGPSEGGRAAALLEVACSRGERQLAAREVTPANPEAGGWREETLEFTLDEEVNDLEFRVHYLQTADVSIDYVEWVASPPEAGAEGAAAR